MVTLKLRSKIFESRPGLTLLSTLSKLGIIPESVLATRNGELLTEDEILLDDDFIGLIEVISGG